MTSRAELEQAAFGLFAAHGFDATTVDEIAAAAGIGRRTFFRYFPSKNDIPWGAFEAELDRMRVRLKACPPEVPLMDAIRVALIDFNQVSPAQIPLHRRRMELILRVPALLAHSTLRFTAWRAVIAEFAAERTGQPSRRPRAAGDRARGPRRLRRRLRALARPARGRPRGAPRRRDAPAGGRLRRHPAEPTARS